MLVSKVLYFHPEPWRNDPIWRAYFLEQMGWKPPPGGSTWTLASLHRCWKRSFKGSFLASMNEGWPSKQGKARWWRETNHGMFGKKPKKVGKPFIKGSWTTWIGYFILRGIKSLIQESMVLWKDFSEMLLIIWVDVVWWPLLNAATGFRCLFLHIHTYR